MTERSEAVKEWLQGIDGTITDPIPDWNNRLYDVYRISNEFKQVLSRMRHDFEQTSKGNTEFTVVDSRINDRIVQVVNPSNHKKISKALLRQIENRISDAMGIVNYPNEVEANFMVSQRGSHLRDQVSPELAKAQLRPLKFRLLSVAALLEDSKTLDLRDDYPAVEAFNNIVRDIEKAVDKSLGISKF